MNHTLVNTAAETPYSDEGNGHLYSWLKYIQDGVSYISGNSINAAQSHGNEVSQTALSMGYSADQMISVWSVPFVFLQAIRSEMIRYEISYLDVIVGLAIPPLRLGADVAAVGFSVARVVPGLALELMTAGVQGAVAGAPSRETLVDISRAGGIVAVGVAGIVYGILATQATSALHSTVTYGVEAFRPHDRATLELIEEESESEDSQSLVVGCEGEDMLQEDFLFDTSQIVHFLNDTEDSFEDQDYVFVDVPLDFQSDENWTLTPQTDVVQGMAATVIDVVSTMVPQAINLLLMGVAYYSTPHAECEKHP